MGSASRIEDLRRAARYHRERYQLYRAKAYGPRATSPTRLRELEQACLLAESSLRRAERENLAEAGPNADTREQQP